MLKKLIGQEIHDSQKHILAKGTQNYQNKNVKYQRLDTNSTLNCKKCL